MHPNRGADTEEQKAEAAIAGWYFTLGSTTLETWGNGSEFWSKSSTPAPC